MKIAATVVAATLCLTATAQAGTFRPGMAPVAGLTPIAGQSGACSTGAYRLTPSPDGATLSVLFDNFTATAASPRANCTVRALLQAPRGYALAVYGIDYRGFSALGAGQRAKLTVQDTVGARFGVRNYQQTLTGPSVDDFQFHQTLPHSPIQSVMCGGSGVFNISVGLQIDGAPTGSESVMSLDSIDAAPEAALVYRIELVKC